MSTSIRSITVAIAALLFSLESYTQGSIGDDTLAVLGNWKKGDHHTFSITRSKQKNKGGVEYENFSFDFIADITVTDSTSEGYKLDCIFSLTDEFKEKNPMAAIAMPIYNNLKVVYTSNIDGSFKDLENWREIVDVYLKMAQIGMSKESRESSKEAFEKVKKMFDTKEMAEASLIKEIQLYHSIYGAIFSHHGIISATSLPNPITSEPLPAFIEQKLLKNNSHEKTFQVEIKQTIQEDAMRNLVYGLIEKMEVPKDSLDKEVEKLLENFEIQDYSTYTIDKKTGWINFIEYIREARLTGMYQKEIFIFKKINE